MITDIYFDLDHTLWDFEKNSALAFEEIFKKNAINVDINDYLKLYVPINVQYWDWYRNEKITQAELQIGRLKDTLGLLNYEIDDQKLHFLADEYAANLPNHNHLFEGCIEILEYLKPKYKLHIITNGFQNIQDGKMKNSNLQPYFETITNSEMAGCKKPNPKIFEHSLALKNVKKENAIMIGDCLDADVGGALKFGIDAIWFNEHHKQTPLNIKQVNYLIDLKNFL